MTSRILTMVTGLLIIVAPASPARADHDPTPPRERGTALDGPGTESSIDINLRLGLNGFRLGTRLFGREGYAGGAWLNGEVRPDGFGLDARIERDGKAHNFKLDADIDEWLRALRWWRGGLDL